MKFELDFNWVFPFLNSSFFVALVTFLFVVSVVAIYKKQKKDEKNKAARIVWVEIIDAERII